MTDQNTEEAKAQKRKWTANILAAIGGGVLFFGALSDGQIVTRAVSAGVVGSAIGYGVGLALARYVLFK